MIRDGGVVRAGGGAAARDPSVAGRDGGPMRTARLEVHAGRAADVVETFEADDLAGAIDRAAALCVLHGAPATVEALPRARPGELVSFMPRAVVRLVNGRTVVRLFGRA